MESDKILLRLAHIESNAPDDDIRFLSMMVGRLVKCVLVDSNKLAMIGSDTSDLQQDIACVKQAVRELGGTV